MVCRCVCFSVTYSSQMRVNSFSFKKVTSILEVAANQSCGKASSDSGLRLSMSISKLFEAMLNKVTLRNLIRLAGISLSYWLPHMNNHVVKWLKSCIQGFNQESTDTAFLKEVFWAQEPKFNRLKNRKNLRTTGFNFYNDCYKRKRSVHSILRIKEGTQVNKLFEIHCRLFTIRICLIDLNEQVLATELKQIVEKSKEKSGRYSNLFRIISSLATIKLAYLMVNSNLEKYAEEINNSSLSMSDLEMLQKVLQSILCGKAQFSSVKYISSPKSCKSGLQPSNINIINLCEKIIQKAIELVLTIIFEEIFLDCSYGSKLNCGRHTALKYLFLTFRNVSMYPLAIEGNIKGCFDSVPHEIILKGLMQKVDCDVTLNLIRQILNAGYILSENRKKIGIKNVRTNATGVGIPSGIILSSFFINMVLHELDKFVNESLCKKYNISIEQKTNLKSDELKYQVERKISMKRRHVLMDHCEIVPLKCFYKIEFKRLFYVRYIDEWVILLVGSLKDVKFVQNKIFKKLQNLGLTLNKEKIRILSLKKDKCRFLGVDFSMSKDINERYKFIKLARKSFTTRQKVTLQIILQAPVFELLIKLKNKGFVKQSKKGVFFPVGKVNCLSLTHSQILNYFNHKIRGILNYYSCVHNRNGLWSIVRFLNYSCALTLARKYKLKTLASTFKKFGRDLEFVNKKGERYKMFRPENFKILRMSEKFRNNESIDIENLFD